ncbi:hypothetical protein DEJ28_05780 [Curtobacterium sp. MCPF17_002]|jgi:hypothetical protein|uniref:hypothetical protein n=1 Tax=Curtobacterium sp. MCPF17_002 TaxID=2175645 RepID=UPI000DA6F95D|nr:hypothetical protein [Curtobacterium sp. MCPF17_002]WIB78608.1 hypothetical protein DEJ28_05780 [Curtobacterium sp. MCPF17_002]
MNETPEHPALVRLRAELDAAWKGIGVLGDMEDDSRDRVVAELRTAVPDVASRAARAAGADAAVAEISRFAEAEVVASDAAVPTATIWDDIVHNAAVAASASR